MAASANSANAKPALGSNNGFLTDTQRVVELVLDMLLKRTKGVEIDNKCDI